MCLIVFAWQVVPGMPLIAAANRDEFHARPSAPAQWWEDHPTVYAGRDLEKGGSWMGIARDGRFAAVTNIRAADEKRTECRSRGALVAEFLSGVMSAQEYLAYLAPQTDAYHGFNLLIGDRTQLIWYSNRYREDARNGRPLPPGIYGMSNASLDAPWPKVVRTKAEFASLLCQGASEDGFFEMLTDTRRASDCRLPQTGIPLDKERALSAVFIDTEGYGTRCSTIIKVDGSGRASLSERTIC